MRLLINIFIDFILFSSIEGYIFCEFYNKVGKCKKNRWYQILLIGFVNCLLSQLIPNVIYQIVMVIWMSIFLYVLNQIKIYRYYLKLCIKAMLLFFIIEIIYGVIIQSLFKFNGLFSLDIIERIKLFCIMIPLRIIEIIIIEIWGRRNKNEGCTWWRSKKVIK